MVLCHRGEFIVTITKDQDRSKGAVEQDERDLSDNTSLQGQLGHRDQDPLLKSGDTDFPEPGGSAEHSGEPEDKRGRTDAA
jgi:hypothetical protein